MTSENAQLILLPYEERMSRIVSDSKKKRRKAGSLFDMKLVMERVNNGKNVVTKNDERV